ncbi:MAG: YfhO family protein [bacterium]
MQNINKKTFFSFFILIFLVAIFYKVIIWTFFAHTSYIVGYDGIQQYTFIHFLKHNFTNLWNPYILGGIPSIANIQTTYFYFLNFLLFFFSSIQVTQLYLIFHIFIGAIGMYFLGKILKFSLFGCLISSIIFVCSGFFVWNINGGYLLIIAASAWIPLIFYLTELFLKEKKILHPILISCLIAFQIILVIQIAFYTILILFLYLLFHIFFIEKQKNISKNIFFGFLMILFLPILLLAIQFLPTMEILSHLLRGSGSNNFEYSTAYSLHPKELIYLIFPEKFHFGQNTNFFLYNQIFLWTRGNYIGLSVFLLSIIGFFFSITKKNKQMIFFSLLVFFSFLFAMGKYTPFFKIIYSICPPISIFRIPGRMLVFFTFSIAILSGYGFSLFFEKFFFKNKQLWKIIVVIIIFLNLFILGGKKNNSSLINIQKLTSKTKNITQFLQKDKDIFRIVENNKEYFQNASIIYKMESIKGYALLVSKRYAEFISVINNAPIKSIDINFLNNTITCFSSHLLSLLNIKYVITDKPIENQNWLLVFKSGITKIYKNKFFLPRVFLTSQAKIIDSNKVLEEIKKDSFDYRKCVILEENFNIKKLENCEILGIKIPGIIKNIKYKNGNMNFETNIKHPCFLVISENNFPGWQIFVNGKKQKIFKANYIMQAIFLDKGNHQIKVIYNPISLKIGAFISIITLLIISIFIFKKNIYKQ